MQCESSDEEWSSPFSGVEDPLPNEICPFATTSEISIKRMLEITKCSKEDIVCDLGCGDGRIAIYAAKHFGIKSIGLDINPELIELAKENAKKENVDHLVTFKLQDMANDDFDFKLQTIDSNKFSNNSDTIQYPTILTCYLIPRALKIIEPKIKKLVRGKGSLSNHRDIRVATIVYPFERWQEIETDKQLKIFLYNNQSIDIIPKSLDSSNPVFI